MPLTKMTAAAPKNAALEVAVDSYQAKKPDGSLSGWQGKDGKFRLDKPVIKSVSIAPEAVIAYLLALGIAVEDADRTKIMESGGLSVLRMAVTAGKEKLAEPGILNAVDLAEAQALSAAYRAEHAPALS